MKKQEKRITLSQFHMEDAFWSYYQNIVRDKVIPYQKAILEDKIPNAPLSHAIDNFRIAAGEKEGEFYGMPWQDSDVYKWLEAVAYSLQNFPDDALEKEAEEVIRLIGKAQEADGYLDTYFILGNPERKWENLHECHELYCAGHLIESAVAWYEGTGKTDLLKIAVKLADHIDARFGKGKNRGIPGHEEIELALIRLYYVTKEKRYLSLSEYFLNERGKQPDFFVEEAKRRNWSKNNPENGDPFSTQNHLPVRKQKEAVGHSVRAMYLYTAMTMMAVETDDEVLSRAVINLWESTTQKKMYITAGIGSTACGEAFTGEYDLPNDLMYAETCASVGLAFWARCMLETECRGEYADVLERALYNGALSGMQRDGKKFFYVNPLEVIPGISGVQQEYAHVLPERAAWYPCACCPPNLARLLMSLQRYAWGENETEKIIYSHLYLGGELKSRIGSGLKISVASNYPWEGRMEYLIQISPDEEQEFTFALRIPSWCKKYNIQLNNENVEGRLKNGYIYLKRCWKNGDRIILDIDMRIRRVYANEHVRQDIGLAALMRGPVCYCFEEVDNGSELFRIYLDSDTKAIAHEREDEILGRYTSLTMHAQKILTEEKTLYSEEEPAFQDMTVTAVPYFLWGNRGKGEMRVWMHKRGL